MMRIADLFCGAGGETTGIVQAMHAGGWRYDLAAVNHWQRAIETHQLNHPLSRAYCQDLATLDPLEVFGARDRVDLLWASPECTHHSVARGGRPRSDQGRASAWLILKWLSELYVRRVILENVPEFVNWGPLGADGQPLKSQKGATFRAFVSAIESMGYRVEWRLLCAADYGDPTTRTRLFVQAVRGGARIVWPEPTHARAPTLFAHRPWVPARDVIDWSIRGESIFSRKRPLAPATLRRIDAGIRRYWGEWAEPFLLMLTHVGRTHSVDEPLATVTTAHRGEVGVVQSFMVPMYGERDGQGPRTHSVGEPVPTIPASGGGKFGVVEPFILHQDAPGAPRGVADPVPAIRTRNGHGIVEPFVVRYHGSSLAESIREPLSAVTTRDRYALIDGQPVGLDITFRMLQPHELAAAQGFPADYRFAGNRTEVVKQIGNAVPVNTARALAIAALGAA